MKRKMRFAIAVVIAVSTLFVTVSAYTEKEENSFNAMQEAIDQYYVMTQCARWGVKPPTELNGKTVNWDDIPSTVAAYPNWDSQASSLVKLAYSDSVMSMFTGIAIGQMSGGGGYARGGGSGRREYENGIYKLVLDPRIIESEKEAIYNEADRINDSGGYITRQSSTVISVGSGWWDVVDAHPNGTTAEYYYSQYSKLKIVHLGSNRHDLYIGDTKWISDFSATTDIIVRFSQYGSGTYNVELRRYTNDANHSLGSSKIDHVNINGTLSTICKNVIETIYFEAHPELPSYTSSDYDGIVGLPMYNVGDTVSTSSVFYNLFYGSGGLEINSSGVITSIQSFYQNNHLINEKPYLGVNLDKMYSSDGLYRQPSTVIENSSSGNYTDPIFPSPSVSVPPSESPSPSPSGSPFPDPSDELDDDTNEAISNGWNFGSIVSGMFGGVTNFFTSTLKGAISAIGNAFTGFFSGLGDMFTVTDNYIGNLDPEVKAIGSTGGAFVNLFSLLPSAIQSFLILSTFLLLLIVILKLFL